MGVTIEEYFEYDESSRSCLRIKYSGVQVGSIDTDLRNGAYKRWRVSWPGKGLQLAHRIVWILFHGSIEYDQYIDHIDGNALNNRIDNLRIVTQSMNNRNTAMKSNNKSGKTGVFLKTNSDGRCLWTAMWYDAGQRRTKSFSVNKYGFDAARSLASAYRDEKIIELNSSGNGYSTRHGT